MNPGTLEPSNPVRPRLSVLIVTWNSAADIEPCLDSLHAERPFEVIVVDNASEDDTRARLAGYHHARVIENTANLGYARANNQGLASCRGEFVLLLNPDTRVLPGALDRLVEHLDQNPGHAAVAPRLADYDRTDRTQQSVRDLPTASSVFWELIGLSRLFPRSRKLGALRMAWFDYGSPGPAPQPMTSCLLVRRAVLEKLGGFDEAFPILYPDVDLSRRMRDSGLVTWFLPDAVVAHRRGASTARVKPRMIREQYRSLIRYLRKHDRGGWFWLKSVVLVPLSGIVMALRIAAWRLRRR
ncbi:glycosyltransferase family 2 protein [candidate division WOR-3 bacterium]|nr:glycosyltransferase family 2 protein [candidate division WOR-3 bacterium]